MQKIIIKKNNADIRLDKFLSREFFSPLKIALQSWGKHSRGEIIKNIKEGGILINEKKVKPSYILKEKDVIVVNLKTVSNKLVPNKNIYFEIIYQDKNMVVINKPAGLKVHPSSIEEDNTLANGLLSKFPEIENVTDGSAGSSLRPGIIHRLDQDTSGIMIIPRNQKSFNELKEIFQTRKITKQYLALVMGKIKDKKGVIEKPIARSSSYKKQTIAGRKTKTMIRKALTEYEVLQEFSNFSLVEVKPKTGRMHQIRIHFFSLGNPVAGDKKYKLKKLSKIILPERQLLHAERLAFELFGRKYSFNAELPQDFNDFLTKLQ